MPRIAQHRIDGRYATSDFVNTRAHRTRLRQLARHRNRVASNLIAYALRFLHGASTGDHCGALCYQCFERGNTYARVASSQ